MIDGKHGGFSPGTLSLSRHQDSTVILACRWSGRDRSCPIQESDCRGLFNALLVPQDSILDFHALQSLILNSWTFRVAARRLFYTLLCTFLLSWFDVVLCAFVVPAEVVNETLIV